VGRAAVLPAELQVRSGRSGVYLWSLIRPTVCGRPAWLHRPRELWRLGWARSLHSQPVQTGGSPAGVARRLSGHRWRGRILAALADRAVPARRCPARAGSSVCSSTTRSRTVIAVAVGEGLSLVRGCGKEPRALPWVHDLIRAKAGTEPEVAWRFLIGVFEERSPEGRGVWFLVGSGPCRHRGTRSHASIRAGAHPPARLSDRMVVQGLKRHHPARPAGSPVPGRLRDRSAHHQGERDSLFSFVIQGERGDRLARFGWPTSSRQRAGARRPITYVLYPTDHTSGSKPGRAMLAGRRDSVKRRLAREWAS
jgi:hypothetical protein